MKDDDYKKHLELAIAEALTDGRPDVRAFGRLMATGVVEQMNAWATAEQRRPGMKAPDIFLALNRYAAQIVGNAVMRFSSPGDWASVLDNQLALMRSMAMATAVNAGKQIGMDVAQEAIEGTSDRVTELCRRMGGVDLIKATDAYKALSPAVVAVEADPPTTAWAAVMIVAAFVSKEELRRADAHELLDLLVDVGVVGSAAIAQEGG